MPTLTIAVVAGVLIGLSVGALGGGGSILTVPVLVSLLGVGPQSATSASLIIVGITSIIAAIAHAPGGQVRWKSAVVFGVVGALTAFGGSIANRAVDPQVLLLAFSALMVVAAIAMIQRTRNPPAFEASSGSDAAAPPGGPTSDTGSSGMAVVAPTTSRTVTTGQAAS